ncbi:MAG TPA: lytic transglycosylase domain-containing protein [Burkholderiales bacterium]|nr:lytic transglycosylase domain-containing protein [Burkholderiales bacterium]
MRLPGCVALLAIALCAQAARADVYLEVQKDGTLLLSDRPLSAGARLIRSDRSPAARTLPRDAQIRRAAERHGVDPLLVHAVVRAESGYDPNAVSPKGAAGLMQLMPETARRYGVADRFDPASNLDAGVRYLRHLLRRFGGNLSLALAAYNAGEEQVLRAGGRIPDYRETAEYVRRVRLYYRGLVEPSGRRR